MRLLLLKLRDALPFPATRGPYEIVASRFARCEPSAVIATLRRPRDRTRWQPEVLSMTGPEPLDRGDVQEGRAAMAGFHVQGKSTATYVTPGGFEEDVIVGVRMRVRYDVQETGDGTLVTHTLVADLPGGPLGRALSSYLRWRLKKMQRHSLAGLVAHAESGSSR